jgi:processive 1,2-diacylglycerol beta-glucosyltransferase
MRILIATATAGGGHLAAARALNEAWSRTHATDEVRLVDLVEYLSPLHRKAYTDGYIKLIEQAPALWGVFFERTDNPHLVERVNWLQRMLPSGSRTKFSEMLMEFEPAALLCTHFLPLEMLTAIQAKSQIESPKPFTVTVVTDFEVHALWMEPCVDLYAVAAEHSKTRLLARGIPAEAIVTTGIPISAKFAATPSRSEARELLNLAPDIPVLLVLGGGFGVGPVEEAVSFLSKVQHPVQIVVVAGKNESLRSALQSVRSRHPMTVLGFASNMNELMSAADLVLTKPGGLTSSEALAVGRPMLIFNPIPGQEAANSDFLLENGAAIKLNRLEDLPYRIDDLLGSAQLERMAAAAKALGKLGAADAVCLAVQHALAAKG